MPYQTFKFIILSLSLLSLINCGSGGGSGTGSSSSSSGSLSSSGSASSCAAGDLCIFDDAIAATWTMAIYEDNTRQTTYGDMGTTDNASWSIVELDDSTHGNVIDVQLFQTTGFADFSLQPIIANDISSAGSQDTNLSNYIEGELVFDIRILDWGQNDIGIFTNIQCEWPCRSPYIPIVNQTGINLIAPPDFPIVPVEGMWEEIRIPMQYFIKDNLSDTDPLLNLSIVDVISIAPPWANENAQRGIHYQLDNLRIEQNTQAQNNSEPAFNFFMTTNTLFVGASVTNFDTPQIQTSGRIEQVDGDVVIVVDISDGDIITNADVTINSDQSGNIVFSLSPPSEQGAGTFNQVVTLRACKDQSCSEEYRGSPQRINVHYVVSE